MKQSEGGRFEQYDCVVVGGGPAGLTAAIYLARFHLRTLVIDDGASRAGMIPLTRNHSGYPDGIPGSELLARMREQAQRFGAELLEASVTRLAVGVNGLEVVMGAVALETRAVLLATGVVNRRPDMPQTIHSAALARGLLRYCPICDGYEVTDKRIAVLGDGERGAREALFLRSYSADVTLIANEAGLGQDPEAHRQLETAGIVQVAGPPGAITIEGDELLISTPAGPLCFDTLYPALGSEIRSELAVALGAQATEDGCLEVDRHQRTRVAGLYAAGDVVLGLDQISHAMGEGGVAATTIRNDLAAIKPLWRAAAVRS